MPIPTALNFAAINRRDGALALEQEIPKVSDIFFVKGLQMLVDGQDSESMRNLMFLEIDNVRERHSVGKKILEFMGAAAPAFGMIGTLIGLITMLAQIEDKSAIGIGMSTALITTLYGAVLGYLVFLPVKRKLEDRDEGESLVKEIMIEGILSIQSGDNPRILEEKLLAFLPPLAWRRWIEGRAAS